MIRAASDSRMLLLAVCGVLLGCSSPDPEQECLDKCIYRQWPDLNQECIAACERREPAMNEDGER